MMQTKLFNNREFKLFKDTIKQNLGLLTLSSIISFITFPLLYLLVNMNGEPNNLEQMRFRTQTFYYYMEMEEFIFNPTFLGFIFFITVLMTVVVSVMLMHFLHNKKSLDMYFSLPMKKENIFLSKFFAGLIIIIAPYIINTILFLLVQSYYQIFTMNLAEILYYIFGGLFFILVVYTINCLACVLAKRTIEALLLIGVLNLGILAIYFSMMLMFDKFLAGYYAYITSNVLYLAPSTSILWVIFADFNILVYVFWGAIGIVALILSVPIIKNSKNELIGEVSYTNRGSYFIKGIVIIVSGIIGSIILTVSTFINILPAAIVGFISASLVCYIIIYVLLAKGFNGILKDLKFYAVVSLICITGIITTINGGLGYSTRVPNIEDIESVKISFSSPLRTGSTNPWAYFTLSNDGLENPNTYDILRTFYSKEAIEVITDFHESIVTAESFNDYNNIHNDLIVTTWDSIEYTLKDGKTVRRIYHQQPLESREYIYKLLHVEEFIEKNNILFYMQPHEIMDIGLSNNTILGYENLELTDTIKVDILNALKTDILNESLEDILSPQSAPVSVMRINLLIDPVSIANVNQLEQIPSHLNITHTFTLDIKPTYTTTLELLTDLGYSQYTELDTSDINVIYIVNPDVHESRLRWSSHYEDAHYPIINSFDSMIRVLNEIKNEDLYGLINQEVFSLEDLVKSGYLIEITDPDQINLVANHSFNTRLKRNGDIKYAYHLTEVNENNLDRGLIDAYIIPINIYEMVK